MIGKIKGIVDNISDDHALIDVGGICYIAFCSSNSLSKLTVGKECELLIETHVREDHIHLYGFHNQEEKTTFTKLQSVKGVGTRMALAILSTLVPSEIQLALTNLNKDAFNRVSGVGKKLAERIVTELKNEYITNIQGQNQNISTKYAGDINVTTDICSDAISALVNLGINKADASSRVSNIYSQNNDISVNDLIRLALR